MNNKGFAITTVLYGILILFLMLLLSMMAILSIYKDRLQILIESTNGARDIINGNYIGNENTNNTGNYSYPADIVYLPLTAYRDDCPKGGDAERGICKDQSYEIYAEHDLCYTCQNGKVTKADACEKKEIITCKEKNENWEKASYGPVEGSFTYKLNDHCSGNGEFRVEKGARYFAWCEWMGDYNAVPTETLVYYCPSGYTKDNSNNICYNCYNGGTYDSETQTCNSTQ